MTQTNAIAALADQLAGTAGDVGRALGGIGLVQAVLEEAKDASDAAGNFHNQIRDAEDKVEDLKAVVKVLSKFGPAGKIVGLLGKVIDRVEDGIEELRKQAANTDETFAKVSDGIEAVHKALAAVELPLDNTAADIGGVLGSLREAATAFEIDRDLLDDAQAATLDGIGRAIEGFDANDLGTAQNALAGLADQVSDLVAAADPLAGVSAALERASGQLGSAIAALNPLFAPLAKVADALKPFEWVLGKADWLISKIIDPVLNPILDATGITGLLEGVAAKISGLLPSTAIFDPFGGIAGQILGMLSGGLESRAADLGQVLTGRILGEGGVLAELLADGGAGADLVLGRNDLFGAVSALQAPSPIFSHSSELETAPRWSAEFRRRAHGSTILAGIPVCRRRGVSGGDRDAHLLPHCACRDLLLPVPPWICPGFRSRRGRLCLPAAPLFPLCE
ncbi:hypothetical protein [Mangrovicoccus ximenensis]|uniref:hypothetical protein n=1 Tax=Mangrovicoccus ximenensis TaxID=1911570 RepID=UPI001F15CC67|nr:hypothetical protein [Mangrovicoccus ximenensis]